MKGEKGPQEIEEADYQLGLIQGKMDWKLFKENEVLLEVGDSIIAKRKRTHYREIEEDCFLRNKQRISLEFLASQH